ncbi:MAG: hypothetical protein ACFCU3_02215 [Verrucomicrobiales bacterium]
MSGEDYARSMTVGAVALAADLATAGQGGGMAVPPCNPKLRQQIEHDYMPFGLVCSPRSAKRETQGFDEAGVWGAISGLRRNLSLFPATPSFAPQTAQTKKLGLRRTAPRAPVILFEEFSRGNDASRLLENL